MKICFVFALTVILFFPACASKNDAFQDPVIITSATHQHTLYNGNRQPVEARYAKEGPPAPVITYFTTEENLLRGEGGGAEAPLAVGDYFVKVERPQGNGYRRGPDIKIEYHIQRALVTINAAEEQVYQWDGNSKPVAASLDAPGNNSAETPPLEFSYYPIGGSSPLAGPPTGRGRYLARIVFPGNANYLGASKEIEFSIK
jgi:hypothetical protein